MKAKNLTENERRLTEKAYWRGYLFGLKESDLASKDFSMARQNIALGSIKQIEALEKLTRTKK